MTSGKIEVFGGIHNWDEVRSFLFSHEAPKPSDEQEEDWNMDWGWGEEDTVRGKDVQQEAKENESFKKKCDLWAQRCVIANSPMGNMIVVAHGSKAAFFMSEWDPNTAKMKFSTSFQGDVAQEDGEKVTSAICIPLLCKKKTSPGAPDWTCILLGFSSGYVRMYTENGSNLVNQLFHNQPIVAFKCRSYQPAHSSADHDQLEEFFVLYKTVIVTMDGFGLFQTLRACRNHLARIQANVADMMVDPPPLSYKKWQYDRSDMSVHDCEGIGLQTPGTFDHLCTASVIGGFYAKCQPSPLTSYIFVTTGNKPFAAFQYAQEGQAVLAVTEMAYAMASKLKSSLISAASGWLGFGGNHSVKAPPKEKPQIEPAALLSSRFGFADHRRVGQSLIVSPCRKLSAITDTLGRVILMDNNLGIVVRMWKGYREAQCGWLQVEEDVSSRSKVAAKKALFLVIYAPKRGQIEVFAMQQGPKLASFSVSKNGRLLSTTFGMMGLNNIPIKGGNLPLTPCLFMDSNAQLFSLNIPFHLALCDKTSSKVKDVHLLKTIQRLLRDHEPSTKELLDLLKEVHLQSMINQAFKILSQKCKSKDTLRELFENYLQLFCDQEEKDLSVVFRLQSLLELYSFLVESASKPPAYNFTTLEGASEESHDLTVLQCLHSTKKEMKVLQDMALENSVHHKKARLVTFQDDSRFITLNEFFSSFCVEFDVNKAKASTDHHIKLNHKYEIPSSLGSLLFCGVLNNKSDISEWKSRLKNSSLIPLELMNLALKYWCENALSSSSYVVLMEQLYHLITALCDLEGPASVTNEFSRVSSWWEEMRKELTKSPQIFHIYSFAIVCRGVAIDSQNQAELTARETGKKNPLDRDPGNDDDSAMDTEPQTSSIPAVESSPMEVRAGPSVMTTSIEDWETISLDLLKWNILLKQIEDLSLLSVILVKRPMLKNPTLPLLPNEIDELSVLNLLDKGKGCIAELVGKWLTTIGIDPILVQDETDVKNKSSTDAPPSPEPKGKYRKKKVDPVEEDKPQDKIEKESEPETETGAEAVEMNKDIAHVQELLKILKENFSVSLSSSIILANYCWEYCLEWNKETNEIVFLSAAIQCVNAIPDPHVKQGIMSMMWSTFLVKIFSTLVSAGHVALKEKFGERERFGGFSSSEKQENFLGQCVSFLDFFMEANVLCEGSQPQPSMTTKKSHWSNDVSTASLTDLALVQSSTNYEMILLHYQLALASDFSHKFRIKRASMKPTNLFDTKSRMLLFQALSSQVPYTNIEVDLGLKILREEFLCLCISSAIHEIQEELSNGVGKPSDLVEFKSLVPAADGLKECENWVQKCFDLGRIWGLDLDCLRMNQICEFYSSGYDQLGVELINSVSAKDFLGAKLLVIAGMRLNFIIDNNDTANVTDIVSSISTNLSNWLKSLHYSKLRCLRFSKQSISELAQQLMQLIPETSYDYKLAEELLLSASYLR